MLVKSPVLQGQDIAIVNAGVDGQSSLGHIKNFDLWFSKIDLLRPKYILFYVGVNDFYLDANVSYNDIKELPKYKSSFIYYIYKLIKGMTLIKAYGAGHKTLDIQSMKTTSTPLLEEREYKPLMKTRLDAYLKRLNILAEKTKELGATPVFITQRRMDHWIDNDQVIGIDENHNYGSTKYNGVDMHYMEKLLNDTTMSICKHRSDSI